MPPPRRAQRAAAILGARAAAGVMNDARATRDSSIRISSGLCMRRAGGSFTETSAAGDLKRLRTRSTGNKKHARAPDAVALGQAARIALGARAAGADATAPPARPPPHHAIPLNVTGDLHGAVDEEADSSAAACYWGRLALRMAITRWATMGAPPSALEATTAGRRRARRQLHDVPYRDADEGSRSRNVCKGYLTTQARPPPVTPARVATYKYHRT